MGPVFEVAWRENLVPNLLVLRKLVSVAETPARYAQILRILIVEVLNERLFKVANLRLRPQEGISLVNYCSCSTGALVHLKLLSASQTQTSLTALNHLSLNLVIVF